MRRILREPLLHFVVLGALIFSAHALLNRGGEPEPGRIVVTQGRVESLGVSFSRVWQRPPTSAEMDGLIRDYIREEVLAREAMTLSLDRDDIVIRRRLRQKMEFIANDLAAPPEPTQAELEAFLAQHADRFRDEPRVTLRQVYLNVAQRGDAWHRDAGRMLAELNRPGSKADFRTLGDATLLQAELVDVPASEIARQFGEAFTREVDQVPAGRWQGPVRSGYGAHLVLVEIRTPPRTAMLADVREEVAREWADARRREANEQFYETLVRRYVVTVEGAGSGAHATAVAAQSK